MSAASSQRQGALLVPGVRVQGATYIGICTASDGSLYALLKLDDKPAKRLPWTEAMAWAKGLNADHPTRPEAALIFAMLKDKLDSAWHWTNETCSWDASYAWICHFVHGDTYSNHKSYDGAAVAVRRLPLQSFNSLLELAQSIEVAA